MVDKKMFVDNFNLFYNLIKNAYQIGDWKAFVLCWFKMVEWLCSVTKMLAVGSFTRERNR